MEIMKKRHTEDEIRHVAKIMKIDIQDYGEYVDKIETMIGYFDILDSAGVEDEKITMREISINDLRKDIHVPSDQKLINVFDHDDENYIKAPEVT